MYIRICMYVVTQEVVAQRSGYKAHYGQAYIHTYIYALLE